MKILLVYPNKTSSCLPPLGLGYLTSLLQESYDVKIIDFNFVEERKIINIFKNYAPDIVGFSVQTNGFEISIEYASLFKQINPNVKIIFGGPHPSVLPKETLKYNCIDICVIGEGEISFINLLRAISKNKDLDNIRGIAFKKNNNIKINKREIFIENLDILPFPNRDLLYIKEYLKNISPPPTIMPFTHIIIMRGCSYNCNYCQPTNHIMWGRKVRKRSPKNICEEIEYLIEKYHIKSLSLGAETFTIDRKWALNFCNEYIKRKMDIPWISTARINCLDYDLLKRMKKAGCFAVNPGIESGCQRVLDSLNKCITLKQIKDYVKICNKLKVMVNANFMIGNIEDDEESLKETVELIKEIKPDYLTVYITNPLPGTDLYKEALSKNLITFDKFTYINRHQVGNLILKKISNDRIIEYRKKIYNLYFRLRLFSLLNPNKLYMHINTIKRILSLRKDKLSSIRRSYDLVHTPDKGIINRTKEMIIKGV